MIEKILKLFRFFIPKKQQKASFSDFFNNASPKEMQELMRNVARKANEDQMAILKRYESR